MPSTAAPTSCSRASSARSIPTATAALPRRRAGGAGVGVGRSARSPPFADATARPRAVARRRPADTPSSPRRANDGVAPVPGEATAVSAGPAGRPRRSPSAPVDARLATPTTAARGRARGPACTSCSMRSCRSREQSRPTGTHAQARPAWRGSRAPAGPRSSCSPVSSMRTATAWSPGRPRCSSAPRRRLRPGAGQRWPVHRQMSSTAWCPPARSVSTRGAAAGRPVVGAPRLRSPG